MEEDIQNHSPTVMFRGTPCSIQFKEKGRKMPYVPDQQYVVCLHICTCTDYSTLYNVHPVITRKL